MQRYWPPELARAYLDGKPTPRSSGIALDLWALGCTVYECFTGRHPIVTQPDNSNETDETDTNERQREEDLLRQVDLN
jgi:serine/threonine protein kinase